MNSNKMWTVPAAILLAAASAPAWAADMAVGSPAQQAITVDSVSGKITGWTVNGRQMLAAPAEFTVVDEATGEKGSFEAVSVTRRVNSVVFKGSCADLGLELEAVFAPGKDDSVIVDCTLTDLTGTDRAVTVALHPQFLSGSWNYGHLWTDSGYEHVAPGRGSNQADSFSGHNESQIPLGSFDNGEVNLTLAHSMRKPRFVAYAGHVSAEGNASIGMRVALGMSQDTLNFPGKADFQFAFLGTEGGTNIRGAFDEYYKAFPECFETTAPQGGWALWLGEDIIDEAAACGMVTNQQEYEYSVPLSSVPLSQQNGIASLQYSEPWGMWMPIDREWLAGNIRKDAVRLPYAHEYNSYVDTAAYREYLAADLGSEVASDRYPGLTRDFTARVLENVAIEDHTGEWVFHCFGGGNFPWTPNEERKDFAGGFLLTNCSPWLPAPNRYDIQLNQVEYTAGRLEAAGLKLDMVYLDSLVFGVGWGYYNFRRDHWQYTTVPLTWAMVDGKAVPAMHNALQNAEFLKEFRKYCDEHGYSILVNSWNPVVAYHIGYIDALGCGEHVAVEPVNPTEFRIFRFLGKNKTLSTQDYRLSDCDVAGMDVRLNRGLMYGVWSGTSNKWTHPDVVAKLMQICPHYKELLSAVNSAGWEVLTNASVAPVNPIERWGEAPASGLYYTVMNRAGDTQELTVTVDKKKLPQVAGCSAVELVDGTAVSVSETTDALIIKLQVEGGRTKLLQIK